MNITKTLELSTGNLSEADCNDLTRCERGSEYGVMVAVSECNLNTFQALRSLAPIFRYALDNDISYLNFDRDNEPCEEFEIFDW